jgi:hypothetical protein
LGELSGEHVGDQFGVASRERVPLLGSNTEGGEGVGRELPLELRELGPARREYQSEALGGCAR